WSSTTTISSTRGWRSTSASRIDRTIAPTVGASLRAGRHTETVWSALAATSSAGSKSPASKVAMVEGTDRTPGTLAMTGMSATLPGLGFWHERQGADPDHSADSHRWQVGGRGRRRDGG